jgi:hypothetical protein
MFRSVSITGASASSLCFVSAETTYGKEALPICAKTIPDKIISPPGDDVGVKLMNDNPAQRHDTVSRLDVKIIGVCEVPFVTKFASLIISRTSHPNSTTTPACIESVLFGERVIVFLTW